MVGLRWWGGKSTAPLECVGHVAHALVEDRRYRRHGLPRIRWACSRLGGWLAGRACGGVVRCAGGEVCGG